MTRVSPNQPKTPVRAVRIDDETWARIKAAAQREGVTPSEWQRRAVVERLERTEDRGT